MSNNLFNCDKVIFDSLIIFNKQHKKKIEIHEFLK